MMITRQDLLEELEQEAQTTRRVLEHVPGDKFDWKPHSKSMTLGQLALHLAKLPGAIAELATRSTFDVNTQIPLPSPANVDQLLTAHDQSVARAKQLLGEMDDAMLSGLWRTVSGEQEIMAIPRAALLRSIMLNHKLPPPRPINRLLASGRGTCSSDIRCQCRRKPLAS